LPTNEYFARWCWSSANRLRTDIDMEAADDVTPKLSLLPGARRTGFLSLQAPSGYV